jgi:hypothetical protein
MLSQILVKGNHAMKIDNYDFDNTAKVVFIMNDYVSKNYPTWQDFREFMISMAYSNMHKNTSFSTGGFNLTAYDGPDGERAVRASVSASVAKTYIEKMTGKELI